MIANHISFANMHEILVGVTGFCIFAGSAALLLRMLFCLFSLVELRRRASRMSPAWVTGQLKIQGRMEMQHALVAPDGSTVATGSEDKLRALRAEIDQARGNGTA